MLEWMRSDPIAFFRFMAYRAPAVLIALTLHELSHGYVAWRCGDPTAKNAGRLTLNPFKHLSLIGTLMMFTVGMGWAKPVPVNPNNYRNGRRDDLLVSIAGVTMNFILFLLATFLMIIVNGYVWQDKLFSISDFTSRYGLMCFEGENFWQILSSDQYLITEIRGGSYYGVEVAEWLNTGWLIHVQRFLYQFALCNLGMCIFNLIPFPPLDGFHVVNDILLRGNLQLNAQTFRIAMIALLVLMNTTDVVSNIIGKVQYFVQGNILSGLLALFGLQ